MKVTRILSDAEVAKINKALLDIEASGEAARIFETWFGPGTEMPMKRTFKIQPD